MDQPWLNSYPSNIPKTIDPDQYSSIIDLFEESVNKFGAKPAYTNMGATLTYTELDELSKQFASFLQNKAGLKKGDRVAIQMPNLLQFPIALFGALRAGMTVVNTNPLYTDREMQHQFKDSGAKAIVIVANFAQNLEKIINETDIETVVVTELGDQLGWPKSLIVNSVVKYVKKMVPKYSLPQAYSFYEALDEGQSSTYTRPEFSSSDIAFLQYTGGTTGVSKGAILTHRNIIANLLQIFAWMSGELEEGKESVITALPLYHIFSLTVNCLAFMRFGMLNILITNPRDIDGFIKTLKAEDFSICTGVNTLYNALMNHPQFGDIDFSKLKISVAGGMALQGPVAKRWQELTGTPLVEGYGLTEASPVVCVNPINGQDKTGTIGLPVPSTNVKLLEDGELCVKGPQVMQGYWQRPDETANVLNDGWLKTGDVADMDSEGFFKIVDRKKDMILVSGFNVFPNEIEDVVAGHDAVLEVAAVGVPDEKSGEVVKIFVVKKTDVTSDELREFCKEKMVAYKVPKHVEFRDELPKTNVGKILRRALRGA